MRASPSRDYQEAPERQDQKSRDSRQTPQSNRPGSIRCAGIEIPDRRRFRIAEIGQGPQRLRTVPAARLDCVFSLNSFQLISPTASGAE